MQAIVLDVLLIFLDLLERSFNPRDGFGLDVVMSLDNAEDNLGESEVREAHLAKALYFVRISDKDWYGQNTESISSEICGFITVLTSYTACDEGRGTSFIWNVEMA